MNDKLAPFEDFTIIEVKRMTERGFMMIKLVLATFVPFLLVLLFTRVTYSYLVATLLTAGLLFASYLAGHMDTIYIAILDVASLAAGFIVARSMVKEKKKSS